MIKKLKLGLLIAVLSLAVGIGSASAEDVNFTTDTDVSLSGTPGVGNLTIAAGSGAATSVIVNPTTIVVTAGPVAGTFTLRSAGGFTLGAVGGTSSTFCSGGTTTTVITAGSATVTFTPTTVIACTPPGGSGSLGGTTGGGSGSTTPDVTAPNGTININGGTSPTNSLTATLNITSPDSSQIMISNDSNFTGASWEPFTTSRAWVLSSGDGVKNVFIKFRDIAGNISSPAMATITVAGSGTVMTPPVYAPGCSLGTVVSITTGMPCSGGVVITPVSIPGCGNSTAGSSPLTGQSCATNWVAQVSIAGCVGTAGASPITGQSCANNWVGVSPTGQVYNFGSVTLRNGSSGAAVMELQRFLNRFLNLGLVVDGKLGPKTIAVIKKWQAANGLVADGLVGPKTMAKMNAMAALY